MNEQSKNRLRQLAQPHESKSGWQQEMDALVVDVLAEVESQDQLVERLREYPKTLSKRVDKAEARVVDLQVLLDEIRTQVAKFNTIEQDSGRALVEMTTDRNHFRSRVTELEACEVELQKVLHRRTEKLGRSEARVADLEGLGDDSDYYKAHFESADKRAREAVARVAEIKSERNNARAIARVLAHAYQTDTRPPSSMVREAMTFEVDQSRKVES